MKGKIVLFLFALPFLGFAAWMAVSIATNAYDALQMRDWTPVEAHIVRAGVSTHSGDDSETYQAYAEYRYSVGGRSYRNDRVAIAGGADNIGDYQQDLGRRLRRSLERGETIRVYVDAKDPQDSVIDRDLRWGLLGFKAIFVLVFGGIGSAVLVFGLRGKATKSRVPPDMDSPWLANDAWQTGCIGSNSKSGMYFTWGFAALWNLISAPLPFLMYREIVVRENYPALFGLLFPLIGICLLGWAIRRTLEWKRFGYAPVTLDPFPGSIGGDVGGVIDLGLPFDPGAKFVLTLASIRSSVTGSGKNRKRTERAEWQDTRLAHAAAGSRGTRLTFRFQVPEGPKPSDASPDGDTWQLWRLSVTAELPGVDLSRDYEIPVYATTEKSGRIPDSAMRQIDAEQHRIDDEAVAGLVRLDFGANGRRMLYPMGRNAAGAAGSTVLGALFAGIGWFLIERAGESFMGGVFGIVGSLILVGGLYLGLNSLEVDQDGMHIRTLRRILGIPVRRRAMRRTDFVRFEKSVSVRSQSGGRHVIHYTVHAVDRDGRRMVVGESFRGAGRADAGIRLLAREFGLRPVASSAPSTAVDAADSRDAVRA